MKQENNNLVAILGPTNTGKTYLAFERLMSYKSGIFGFPLRLLARENYDKAVNVVGLNKVGLITGEEKILPNESPDKQYQFATSFLKVGDYSTAERAFREFVDTNPEHNLAGNAQYWYAETFRIRQLYTDAASAYLEGYQRYPKGEKAPINLLKLGVSMVQIGEKDQGCKMINGVEEQYPEANQSVIQKAKYESQKFECNNQNS